MLRKFLIGLAIIFLLLFGAIAFLYFKFQPIIREATARSEAKQKMLQPRIVKGADRFERQTFYAAEGLGNVSQINVGWPADRENADVVLVGRRGADFIDLNAQVKKTVRFSTEQCCPVALARMDSEGEYGYLTRDESWSAPATLFGKDGHVKWRSEDSGPGVDDSVAGDTHGDGRLSVAIGFNGGGGLVLLDSQGKKEWRKEESNVWHVEFLDTNGDGRQEILHSNAKGELLVRNELGDKIGAYVPDFYVSHFALTRWEQEPRPTHVLVPTSASCEGDCKPVLIVLDATGKKIAELESPLGDLFTSASSTPIRFGKSAGYFAVLDSELDHSMLILYANDRQIVYQEILGEPCHSLTALPTRNGERLLVGCTDKVWAYSPTPATAAESIRH